MKLGHSLILSTIISSLSSLYDATLCSANDVSTASTASVPVSRQVASVAPVAPKDTRESDMVVDTSARRDAAPVGYFGEIALAVLAALFMGIAIFVAWHRLGVHLGDHRGHELPIVLAGLAMLFLICSAMFAFAPDREHWRWFVSIVPPLLILKHAASLYVVRRGTLLLHDPKRLRSELKNTSYDFLASAINRAVATDQRYFGVSSLVLRYALPAFVLGLVCHVGTGVLSGDITGPKFDLDTRRAAVYGLAGAYVYVLLYLGKRSFQGDITTGAATWAVVTLAVGPLLAGLLGTVWDPTTTAKTNIATGGGAPLGITEASVYFLAGFSPKITAAYLESAIRRMYWGQSVSQGTLGRAIPLMNVRGMHPEVVDRLEEEGIHDAITLAGADPLRLFRNTSYDLRQIINWIDHAILVATLPETWPTLERLGITGAIDLAWYHKHGADFATLADEAKIEKGIVQSASIRLYEDNQVRLIWLLYQLEGGDGDEAKQGAAGVPPPEALPVDPG
jgi:hypothetical protein